tara:strand:+ start:5559 stop:7814 length:2256 start_codon:yes stop_codon:yes gene_type:complete
MQEKTRYGNNGTIKYIGEKVDVVNDNTRYARNRNKQWEYGYNEEYDIVIISKDGTLGEIYEMAGIKVGLPNSPDIKDIFKSDEKRENQVWKRTEVPKGLTADNWENLYGDYVEQQFDYRNNGYWLMIDGQKIYLTGTYWYFLQWVKIEGDYNNYRGVQNEFMIFWEACKADHRCYGMIYGKNRRMGATSMGVAESLETGSAIEDKFLGIISKAGKPDAKDIFDRCVTAFKRLPPFFKPRTDGQTTPKTELVFKEESRKRKKGETIIEGEGLNTTVKWFNTSLNSMDGMPIFRVLIDEYAKWSDVPFDKYWRIIRTSMTKGRRIFGKAMCISTVNHWDKGGKEAYSVWKDSDIRERDLNGQTLSGLYKLFIPSKYCMEGFYDIYGNSIIDDNKEGAISDMGDKVYIGSISYLRNKLQKLKKDPEKYYEELRQFPDTERDMFRRSSDECYFNGAKLQEQIEYNQYELEEDDYGNNSIERGNFVRENGLQDGDVIWKPDPKNGRFWLAKGCHPPPEMRNKKEMIMKHGVYAWSPGNPELGSIGIDPFNRSKTSDGRGSDGAIHLLTRYNALGFPNNAFILEYLARPKKIEIFYEDCISAMVYFGVPILPELSSDRFSAHIIERGYRHYVLTNPYKLWSDLTPTEKEMGGVNAQGAQFREAQFQAVNTYIEDYIGLAMDNSNREIGEMGFMPFTRTLEQWLNTDPDKRTDFDAYISSSLAIIANQGLIKKDVQQAAPIKMPFKRFDNSGNISVMR